MKHFSLIGIATSVASLVLLFTLADLPDFGAVARRIGPASLAPFALAISAAALLLALRWKQLAGRALGFRSALSASLVGAGGNMVLPLRGGDVLKILRTSAGGRTSLADSAGSLVVEKVLDLAATAAIALAAGGILLDSGRLHTTTQALAAGGATLALLVAAFVLVRAGRSGLARHLERLLARLGMQRLHASLVRPLLERLGGTCPPQRLVGLVGTTAALHLGLYAFIYIHVGYVVGIDLGYPEALFVLAVAAFGMTLPAAPSGLGVYHAAVASAFYALGRPVSEGVALGVAVHALVFAAFVIPAAFVWLFDALRLAQRRRTSAELP